MSASSSSVLTAVSPSIITALVIKPNQINYEQIFSMDVLNEPPRTSSQVQSAIDTSIAERKRVLSSEYKNMYDVVYHARHDAFMNEIKDYTEEIKINLASFSEPNEFIAVIAEKLELDVKTEMGNTEIIHESFNECTQICYIQMVDSKTVREQKLNKLGQLLSLAGTEIKGNVFLFCNKISPDGIARSYADVTKERLYQLCLQKFYHQGVLITTRNEIVPLWYNNLFVNLDTGLSIMANEHIIYPTNILNFDLVLVIEKKNHDEMPKNKLATKIAGNLVKGDMMILQRLDEDNKVFGDCDEKLIKRLLKLSEFTMQQRALLDNEIKQEKKDRVTVVKNRYQIIEKRLREFKIVCNNCSQEMKKIYICSGCHRIKYCSADCQRADRIKHRLECQYSSQCFNCCAERIIASTQKILSERKENVDEKKISKDEKKQ